MGAAHAAVAQGDLWVCSSIPNSLSKCQSVLVHDTEPWVAPDRQARQAGLAALTQQVTK